MTAYSCPCGFDPWSVEARLFSPEWYQAHRAHHLAVYPDVDEGTKRNLAALCEPADERPPCGYPRLHGAGLCSCEPEQSEESWRVRDNSA